MALAESWHVRSRSRECAATGRRFEDGEPLVTALFPDPESSGYLRRDFCIEAWDQRDGQEPPPFSFWRSLYQLPESETREDPMKKLSPEELLERLIEEDQEHTENTRYILAVMLERKKLLRETDKQQTANGILRVYEHRKSGEVYLVRDPNIPLEEVEKVQQEVFVLLENNGRLPDPVAVDFADSESPAAGGGEEAGEEAAVTHDEPAEATATEQDSEQDEGEDAESQQS